MRDSSPSWQKTLAAGFNSASELLAHLKLPQKLANTQAEMQFQTRVPLGFAELMEPGNPNDPLLLQVLAVQDELLPHEQFSRDPLREHTFNTKAGLIHKYHSRVLLTLVGACAINCRYCFRRHFPYQANNPGKRGWEEVFAYIAADESIEEVILSGGDPLLANDGLLSHMIDGLSCIPHLSTLRIHTRIPVVLPERVDSGLVRILKNCTLNKVIVLHCNHPNEIDARVTHACQLLSDADCHLLNQSVLLAKVNDDANVLAALSRKLFNCGVLPYYLHLLDKVDGAAHFDVSLEKGRVIFKTMQSLLPGYLVPRLAAEIAGQPNKTLL